MPIQYDDFGNPVDQPGEATGNPLPGNNTPIDETGNITAPDNQAPNTPGGNAAGDPTTPPVTPTNPVEANRQNITNPTLPAGATVTPTLQTADPNLIRDPNSGSAGDVAKATNVAPVKAAQASAPAPISAETVSAQTISGQVKDMTAEQGNVSQQAQVQAQQQQGLSSELKSELDSFRSELDAIGVDPNMTVQGQYSKLMEGFDNGGTPPWAAGAIKRANQTMAARGLGGSSMAAGAVSAAIMQAALPIASQDAQVFKDLKLAVLDKKAQGAFLRAGFIANLDMANLNNRQQAAVVNAQSFLAMDMKNLDARQQTAIINTQSRLQALMSDQSAINSAQQFNAASKNQVNQFYAQLASDTEKFNASQANAMAQFNAGEQNATNRFNTQAENARKEFNVKQQTLIDQANLTYQRNINSQNNYLTNQANMVNSQNLVNISNTAMANEIQLWRDGASYLFQSGENDKDRALQLAINNTQNAEWFKRYSTQQKDSFWNGVGNFLFKAGGNILEDYLDGGFND